MIILSFYFFVKFWVLSRFFFFQVNFELVNLVSKFLLPVIVRIKFKQFIQ